MKVYSVVITTYEDNYKHRYDDGVYPEQPVLFKKLKDAENYVCERIFTEIDSDDTIKYNDEHIKMCKDENGDEYPILDESIKYDFEIMNKLKEELLVGEFVDYKLDYTIQECEIRESTINKKEEKKIEDDIVLCECEASVTKKSYLRHKSSLKHAYFELKQDYDKRDV
jgi:hypothetical protein